MTLRVDRSLVTESEAIALDDAVDCAKARRERNRAAGRCIGDTNPPTHGPLVVGARGKLTVRCARCLETHRRSR